MSITEYCSTIKWNEVLVSVTTWMNLKNTKFKKPDKKGDTLYDFIHMKYSEQVNARDRKQTVSCQGLEAKGNGD